MNKFELLYHKDHNKHIKRLLKPLKSCDLSGLLPNKNKRYYLHRIPE
ncbi:hypothetical protein CLV59_108186 [Chitinophaga dinghuensis]|uniref:Uncharacterized protein n=1 Tax=Chitinophaga dinghuensis TaxID=1539050 RepID=A0A327VQD2_9BACT|nr:hypothetical protein CLV59_108186 [Chitinophaga dinghuensis]